ncbi:hypothetical protein ACJMK2_013688 [Sinanodonta woodiana]|uniref:Uncharacterized protein n=1 Tax=Sinanodonta woodiana TaxID=1069815 RepID=A0ABD3V1A7_SINWO
MKEGMIPKIRLFKTKYENGDAEGDSNDFRAHVQRIKENMAKAKATKKGQLKRKSRNEFALSFKELKLPPISAPVSGNRHEDFM